MLALHLPAACGLLQDGNKSSEPRFYDFPSLLHPTVEVTAGEGLKILRTAGRVLESLRSNPIQSRTQCSPSSWMHVGDTPRLRSFLPLRAQTGEPVEPMGTFPSCSLPSTLWLAVAPVHKGGRFLKWKQPRSRQLIFYQAPPSSQTKHQLVQ
jgi:hypothetical protein